MSTFIYQQPPAPTGVRSRADIVDLCNASSRPLHACTDAKRRQLQAEEQDAVAGELSVSHRSGKMCPSQLVRSAMRPRWVMAPHRTCELPVSTAQDSGLSPCSKGVGAPRAISLQHELLRSRARMFRAVRRAMIDARLRNRSELGVSAGRAQLFLRRYACPSFPTKGSDLWCHIVGGTWRWASCSECGCSRSRNRGRVVRT